MEEVLRGQSAAFPSARGVEGGPHDRAARAAAAVDARVSRASEGAVYVGEGVQVSARVVFCNKWCFVNARLPKGKGNAHQETRKHQNQEKKAAESYSH